MAFLNIGKKDENGQQRRVEHRGKHLRASRTGGVALRAQTQALGANLTANSNRGFRVSTTPLKNTQIALQNGRFVLRGRYGRGPLRFNLSKTGASVSSRNRLGSFNWIKPQRSSAKLFGVQVRGRKAAHLQLAYMGLMAAALLLGLAAKLLVGAFTVVVWIAETGYRAVLATPYALRMLRRRWQRKRLVKRLPRLEAQSGLDLDAWSAEQLLAGTVLLFIVWGRGRSARETLAIFQGSEAAACRNRLVRRCSEKLEAAGRALDNVASQGAIEPETALGLMALFAVRLSRVLPEDELPNVLLEADEVMLQEGTRTILQERMVEVFGDFANLALVEVSGTTAAEDAAIAADEDEDDAGGGVESAERYGRASRVDINTASREVLQTLPHIGPERAEAIVAGRPWSSLNQLRVIDGIGPQRLAAIASSAEIGSPGGNEEFGATEE